MNEKMKIVININNNEKLIDEIYQLLKKHHPISQIFDWNKDEWIFTYNM